MTIGSSNMPAPKNIQNFLDQMPGLVFNIGEVGFGRPCVGIIDKNSENYVEYVTYNDEYEVVCKHDYASNTAPSNAYHKHPCLAVLVENDDYLEAVTQLEDWVEGIIKSGLQFHKSLPDKHSISALLGNKHPIIGIKNL